MTRKKTSKNPARSGRKTKFYAGGTYSIILNMKDFDSDVHDDEITLCSDDDAYKQTIKVAEERVEVEENFYRFTFTGVMPGGRFSLVYEMKNAKGESVGTFDILKSAVIDRERLDALEALHETPLEEKQEAEDSFEFDTERDPARGYSE